MRGRGQIAELAAIVKPDVAVITNIAPVHLELVGTIEEVAAAKAEIIAELGKGALVVPADEALLEPHLRYHTGRLVTFGGEGANVCVAEAQVRGYETHALIDAFGRRAAFDFSFSGGHYLQDALAAIGAFIALGYNLEEAKPGARCVEFSALRGRLEELPGGGLLLNDAYNANPLSMKAAIDHLCEVAGERPRVAVLGDMFELGSGAAAFHREVGQHADAKGVRVLAVGAHGARVSDGLRRRRMVPDGRRVPGGAARRRSPRAAPSSSRLRGPCGSNGWPTPSWRRSAAPPDRRRARRPATTAPAEPAAGTRAPARPIASGPDGRR